MSLERFISLMEKANEEEDKKMFDYYLMEMWNEIDGIKDEDGDGNLEFPIEEEDGSASSGDKGHAGWVGHRGGSLPKWMRGGASETDYKKSIKSYMKKGLDDYLVKCLESMPTGTKLRLYDSGVVEKKDDGNFYYAGTGMYLSPMDISLSKFAVNDVILPKGKVESVSVGKEEPVIGESTRVAKVEDVVDSDIGTVIDVDGNQFIHVYGSHWYDFKTKKMMKFENHEYNDLLGKDCVVHDNSAFREGERKKIAEIDEENNGEKEWVKTSYNKFINDVWDASDLPLGTCIESESHIGSITYKFTKIGHNRWVVGDGYYIADDSMVDDLKQVFKNDYDKGRQEIYYHPYPHLSDKYITNSLISCSQHVRDINSFEFIYRTLEKAEESTYIHINYGVDSDDLKKTRNGWKSLYSGKELSSRDILKSVLMFSDCGNPVGFSYDSSACDSNSGILKNADKVELYSHMPKVKEFKDGFVSETEKSSAKGVKYLKDFKGEIICFDTINGRAKRLDTEYSQKSEIKEFVQKIHDGQYEFATILADPREIPDVITSIPDWNGETPKTLQNYDSIREKNREEILEKLKSVGCNVSEQTVKLVEDNLTKIFDSGMYAMNVFAGNGVANKIISSWFKNQHETKTSEGMLDSHRRKLASENMFGTLSDAKAYEYEKYGYLAEEGELGAEQYGDCRFIFKKDRVIGRTTYTLDDSLSYALGGDAYTGICSKGKISFEGLCNSLYGRKDIWNGMASGRISSISELLDERNALYVELQYHGNMTLNDVESFQIEKIDYENNITAKSKKILKEHGIKVTDLYTGEVLN